MQSQEIKSLFEELYTESGNDLNQFIKHNNIDFPMDTDKNFISNLKFFLDAVVKCYLENNDIIILDVLREKENCDIFIKWVEEYVNERVQPLKDTEFIKGLPLEEFKNMVQFCYDNYVAYNSGKILVEGAADTWTIEELIILRQVILTIAEMSVLHFYPRNRILININEIFHLSDDYGNILIDIILKNEERLWKYLMFKQQEHIEAILENCIDI